MEPGNESRDLLPVEAPSTPETETDAEFAPLTGRICHLGNTRARRHPRERVCNEKLVGAAQEFSDSELEDPILRGIDKDDPIARNPCLRRGPLSVDYWTRLPGQLWRSTRWLVGMN